MLGWWSQKFQVGFWSGFRVDMYIKNIQLYKLLVIL